MSKEVNVNNEKKMKYGIVSVCAVALLGCGAAFAMLNNEPEPVHKANGTETIQERKEKPSAETKKAPWEKQVEKSQKKEASKKATKTDDPLALVKDEAPLVVANPLKAKVELLNQLEKAISVQNEKEATRKKEQEVVPLVFSKEEKPAVSLTEKPTNKPNVEKPEGSEELEQPVLPEKPILPNEPVLPDNQPSIPTPPAQNIPSEPEQPVLPEEPTGPSLDELVSSAKDKLQTANTQAQAINQQLQQVQDKLNQLNQVTEKTQANVNEATEHLAEVNRLVAEYNELSAQIKQLLNENNEIPPINLTIYQETYTKLQAKVTEIQEAQKKSNTVNRSCTNSCFRSTRSKSIIRYNETTI